MYLQHIFHPYIFCSYTLIRDFKNLIIEFKIQSYNYKLTIDKDQKDYKIKYIKKDNRNQSI